MTEQASAYDLHIDRDSALPVHAQLYNELRRLVLSGLLAPGAPVPPVQLLCQNYGLSTTTVSRVFRELKQEGLILAIRGEGTFVAEAPAPVTEVLVHTPYPMRMSEDSFYYDIVKGLKRGYADVARRCVMTHYDERVPTAQELRDLMRLRRADGLVVYRPDAALASALRSLARDHRVVCLLTQPTGPAMDCVLSNPTATIRTMIAERIAAGKRQFVYLGKMSLETNLPESPYSGLLRGYREAFEAAGLEPHVQSLDDRLADGRSMRVNQADELLADMAGATTPGTVVVAETPHIARAMLARQPDLDCISYTESTSTVKELGATMTLLYLGLEQVGEAAAGLLREPAAAGMYTLRKAELEPIIIPPGGKTK